jgi:hypothetical protein
VRKRQDLYDIAEQIAAEWRGGTGFRSLMERHKCSCATMQRVICSVVPFDEYIRTINQRDRANRAGFGKSLCQPIGTIRTKREKIRGKLYCYRIIKVSMDGGKNKGWRRLSVYNWEKANGPVPDGHIVACIDGNPMNDDISNLTTMTKRDLVLRTIRTPEWHQAAAEGRERMPQAAKARMVERMAKTLRRRKREARLLAQDQERISMIREIIPIPSCVKERMQSGWWDNREDDDDSEV